MTEPKQRDSKRVKLGVVGMTGALLAGFLVTLYFVGASSHRDMSSLVGAWRQLEESTSAESLHGQLLARLGGGSRATAIGFGPENSFYILLPEGQKVMRLDISGNPVWTVDLPSTCECGFCVNMSPKQDGSLLVLDMRDDQICEINPAGEFSRRFSLPGSEVSVTFGIAEKGVLVNSLLGDSDLAAYDFSGRRLEFASGPAWDTPEKKFSYVMPVDKGWLLVHRYSGVVRLITHDGQHIATFSKGGWDPFRSERTVAYFGCSPGTATAVWCLGPSDSPESTLLTEIRVPGGQATNHKLQGAFRSLAVSGRTAIAVNRRGNEIWEFRLP